MTLQKVYGNNGSSYWRVLLQYEVNNSYSQFEAAVRCDLILYASKAFSKDHTYTFRNDTPVYVAVTGQRYDITPPSGEDILPKGVGVLYGSHTFIVQKTTSWQTINVGGYIKHAKGWSSYKGASSVTQAISIAPRDSYTLSFTKGTTDNVTNMPVSMTKYYGIGLNLPPVRQDGWGTGGGNSYTFHPADEPQRSGWNFYGWSLNGTHYAPKAWFTGNYSASFSAEWRAVDPPTCDNSDVSLEVDVGGVTVEASNIIRNFTDISVDVDNIIVKHSGRTLTSVKMVLSTKAHEYSSNLVTSTSGGTLTIPALTNGTPTLTSADDGDAEIYIVTKDSAGAEGRYLIKTLKVIAPTWEKTFSLPKSTNPEPQHTPSGEAVFDNVYVMDYTLSPPAYVEASKTGARFIDEGDSWGFYYIFNEKQVDDPLDTNPDVQIKINYKHYDVYLSEERQAFYTTSRHQNYSNGIYNQMFASGVDSSRFPNHSSRVWWSQINNPLYFPDTNYLEVGSNDTSVMGLTKVGDYLAAVKQSKTTDTAIYLLFPTSFEDNTTFAVKQGVQGVGALAKYSFNILGDETLFLSPKGVMAIVPSQDEEHKVQNRSYFVDKKLLSESEIESAYSFVYDGKYFLAVPNGEGSVYVLDGNQRNSWGNDRTNLVYECYYLTNIPARCFMKYDDTLLFSTATDICAFGDAYIDAYDALDDDNTQVPVKAEWSTLLDDDGALHYYKTMQKKGNLVSLLPIENERPYKLVAISQEEFEASKTTYYTLVGNKYVQCKETDEYDADADYYIEKRSKSEVLVKKDDKKPVKVERSFGLSSDIPSEMYLNKKFKKYKRLQFIVRNYSSEDFGIDEIIKNYTVGNYAKR